MNDKKSGFMGFKDKLMSKILNTNMSFSKMVNHGNGNLEIILFMIKRSINMKILMNLMKLN